MHPILLISLIVFITSPVSAAIEPPFKTIDYCYTINNIDKFPDYAFLAVYSAGVITGDMSAEEYELLTNGACVSRNTRDHIYAVKKNTFNEKEIGYGSQVAEYFKKHIPLFLDSGVDIPVSTLKTYNPTEARTSIKDEMTINAVNDTGFDLVTTRRLTTFEDGTTHEELFTAKSPALQLENPVSFASPQSKEEKRPPISEHTKWKIVAAAVFIFAIILRHVTQKKTNQKLKLPPFS